MPMIRNIILTILCLLGFAPGANAEILVQISVVPTDLGGTLITSIAPGEDFLLQAIVQDVRDPPPEPISEGVFAGFLNVTYDPSLASIAPAAALVYDPFFIVARTGDVSTQGLVSGAGALSGFLLAPGNDPQPLWNVLVTATSPSVVSFTPSFDTIAGHEVLVFGHDDPVLESEIDFVGSALTIVPEPSGLMLGAIGLLALFTRTADRLRTRRIRHLNQDQESRSGR
jgi:hypothetical protein